MAVSSPRVQASLAATPSLATNPSTWADPLVERLRAGDPDACREMIERHAARMLRILLRLRGDRFEAEDLLQETWIRACQAAREFRGEASLRTWLDRIALNAAAMAERHRLTRSRGSGVGALRLGLALPGDEPAGVELVEPAASTDTESAVVWRETLAELGAAVAALPARLRDVLVLRDIQGASTREAAEELGISEAAVKQRLHRGRGRLRRALHQLAAERELHRG